MVVARTTAASGYFHHLYEIFLKPAASILGPAQGVNLIIWFLSALCRLQGRRQAALSSFLSRRPNEDGHYAKGKLPDRSCCRKTIGFVRGEASRVAKESSADWWSDRLEIGTRFCFVEDKAKAAFALTCDSFGIACRDG